MQRQISKQSWSDKYLTIQSVVGMLSFVFGAGLLYGEFKSMKIKNDELEKEFSIQIELQERRSDNRFARATEWNVERKNAAEKLTERVAELEKEIAYEKGFRDGQKNK